MTVLEQTFGDKVFAFILNEYGKDILDKIRSETNKSIVSKITRSSLNQNDTVEHTGNKIIAMLRMNP